MCYSVESATKAKLKYARLRGEEQEVAKLEQLLDNLREKLPPLFHVSGYTHPHLLAFPNSEPFLPAAYRWGLIPTWVKDKADAAVRARQTLNARSETMFEKPSFKTSAEQKRCLIYVDAFYEHHHSGTKTYPFRISHKDDSPMVLAGLWNNWLDKETGEEINTVSIVTCKPNSAMALIHNNPKAEESRMPVILPRELQNDWLIPCNSPLDKAQLLTLAIPYPTEGLNYTPVHKLLGKESLGNVPEVEKEEYYPELENLLTQLN